MERVVVKLLSWKVRWLDRPRMFYKNKKLMKVNDEWVFWNVVCHVGM